MTRASKNTLSGASLLAELRGGDRRSIGRSNAVAARVLRNPRLFATLIQGMLSDERLVRMRSADAVEKVTATRPELLAKHTSVILGKIALSTEQEVRWHVAQLVPRLPLDARQRRRAVALLNEYLTDPSSIVRTFAMQALADLAERDEKVAKEVLPLLVELTRTGSPAMRARGRKLLKHLRASAVAVAR